MTSKIQSKALKTIKHSGRKFVVIHESVTCKLLKRAGKPQFFTLVDGKAGKLVRHKGYWYAMRAHSDNLDAAGVKPAPFDLSIYEDIDLTTVEKMAGTTVTGRMVQPFAPEYHELPKGAK